MDGLSPRGEIHVEKIVGSINYLLSPPVSHVSHSRHRHLLADPRPASKRLDGDDRLSDIDSPSVCLGDALEDGLGYENRKGREDAIGSRGSAVGERPRVELTNLQLTELSTRQSRRL